MNITSAKVGAAEISPIGCDSICPSNRELEVSAVAAIAEREEWYVMRVTYQRELAARERLSDMGIDSFVPTHKVRKPKRGGGYTLSEVSRLHNYIFIHTTPSMLQHIKQHSIPYLRFMMAKGEDGSQEKQFVPHAEMENFIAICRSEEGRILAESENLHLGDRVRILVGPLCGVEGYYAGAASRGGRRVVVRIEGVAAVATGLYAASQVEKLPPRDE